MKTLVDQLSNYSDYHRNPRNKATHLIGVPMIVLAVMSMLSRPSLMVGAVQLSPALLVTAFTLLYYLRLDLMFGLVMAALLTLALWFGAWTAALEPTLWLSIGIGGFLVGWAFQFVGHYFEGRKPAFVDDIIGLAIGPLFVVAEILFMIGLFTRLKVEIDERSGISGRHKIQIQDSN